MTAGTTAPLAPPDGLNRLKRPAEAPDTIGPPSPQSPPELPARPAEKPRLLEQACEKLRLLHDSKRTEEAYVDWIRRFILFHSKCHRNQMGAAEVESFLSHRAVEGKVAASTQNQALCALFLYGKVLRIELGPVDAVRAQRLARLPVVLSFDEVRRLLEAVPKGIHRLMVELISRRSRCMADARSRSAS